VGCYGSRYRSRNQSCHTFLWRPAKTATKLSLFCSATVLALSSLGDIVGYFFLELYYRYRVFVYDYLGVRFEPGFKEIIFPACFLVMRRLSPGTRLFVPSLSDGFGVAACLPVGRRAQIRQQVDSVWPYRSDYFSDHCHTCICHTGWHKAVIWTDDSSLPVRRRHRRRPTLAMGFSASSRAVHL